MAAKKILLTIGALSTALVLAGLVTATTVMAYIAGPASFIRAPASAGPNQPFAATAFFIQPDGTPFPAGIQITFFQSSGPSGTAALPQRSVTALANGRLEKFSLAASTCAANFSPVSLPTDSAGSATTTVTLPGGCPGQFVICAREPGGTQTCTTVLETGGFPNTVAALTPTPVRNVGWPIAISLVGLIGLVIGSRLILRRR
jgi:hypothetical protein